MFKIIDTKKSEEIVGGKSSVIATSISAIASRIASESDGGKTVSKG